MGRRSTAPSFGVRFALSVIAIVGTTNSASAYVVQPYSTLLRQIRARDISGAAWSQDGRILWASSTNGTVSRTSVPPFDTAAQKALDDIQSPVTVLGKGPLSVATDALSLGALAGVSLLTWRMLAMTSNMNGGGRNGNPGNLGGGGGMFAFPGRTPAPVPVKVDDTTLDDVAGLNYVIDEEVSDMLDYIKRPLVYKAAGAKCPKGLLLEGPPGTGKTLIARALAGTAEVPFFAKSGSDFVEVYVGTGAARVRDLYSTARKAAVDAGKMAAIVFIDEIDAVGKARAASSTGGGGNDERDQTLNQLLVEMDGLSGTYDSSEEAAIDVITIAATNRVDLLDAALLRAGRFDKTVKINLPDYDARLKILEVHARPPKRLDPRLRLGSIAKLTPNFSGAQLEAMMNSAAIRSVRQNRTEITREDVMVARDVTVAGRPLNKSVSAELEMQVAVHEIGHALVASLLEPAYQEVVQRVTITPTSNGAGGLTFFSPRRNDGAQGTIATRTDLQQKLMVLLGGRAAEEVMFSMEFVSLGASHDIQEAERIARDLMVRSGGMTENMGSPRISANLAGPRVADAVDSDAQWFVSSAYSEALELLQRHKTTLLELAERLVVEKSIPGAVVRRSARVAAANSTTKEEALATTVINYTSSSPSQ